MDFTVPRPSVVPTVRDVDGTLVIDWPDPRPRTFEITAEAFEMLIDRVNRGDGSYRRDMDFTPEDPDAPPDDEGDDEPTVPGAPG